MGGYSAPIQNGLVPVADQQSVVLVLGSFPSEQSLQAGQYYANPRNQFWKLMEALFEVPSDASYDRRVASLLGWRIGLWDVIARCRRKGSADAAIRDIVPNALPEFLRRHPSISYLAFNGARAEATAVAHAPEVLRLEGVRHKRLPSSSPAHAVPLARKLESWRTLSVWLMESE